MLLFYCAAKADLKCLRRSGLHAEGVGQVRLWTSLEAAQRACDDHILVVDSDLLEPVAVEEIQVAVSAVPAEAFCNLGPYLPPRPMVAGGGYVVRWSSSGPEVLLIFRRGVWDLPKGKQDPGESVEACALREVREELGIDVVHIVRPLGTTVHGYAEKGKYRVKTTYWYLMKTPEQQFTPQALEGIEQVVWVPWMEAKARLGYDTLRRHMEHVTEEVHRT